MSIRYFTQGTRFSSPGMIPALLFTAAIAALSLSGCRSNANTANPADGTTASDSTGQDPTLANMAPVDENGQSQGNAPNSYAAPSASRQGPTQVKGYQQQAQPSQQSYSNPAPIERRAPSSDGQSGYTDQGSSNQAYGGQSGDYSNSGGTDDDYNAEAGYNATLSDVSAPQPPPPLPTYEQPEAPDPNYLWTPGYWSYTPQGYYWVPGAWTQPPYTGALWTPGYWGGYGEGYRFHRGFWATHIGFYGGVNYGFGYFGSGYQGGYWNGDNFYYNRACNRINERVVRNVYQRNVVINNRVVNNTTINNTTINNTRINNVSYNGGRGGIQAQPRPAELAVLREQRVPPMREQLQHQQQAAQNRQQFYTENHGRPAMVAAVQPLRADRGIIAPAHTTAQLNRALPVAQQIQQERQFVHPATPAGRPGSQPATQPVTQPATQPGTTLAQPGNRAGAVPQQPQQRPALSQQRPGEHNQQPNQPGQRAVPAQGQTTVQRPGQGLQQPVGRPAQRTDQRNEPGTKSGTEPRQGPGQGQGQGQAGPVAQPLRPAQEQNRPVATPEPQFRSPQPQQRPVWQRPQPQELNRPQAESRAAQQQQTRPQPQTIRPQTEQVRPQPQQVRPETQQVRPQPQNRPEPQQVRPQPQVQQARPQPQQQVRPQPQQQVRPQPQQPKPGPHAK